VLRVFALDALLSEFLIDDVAADLHEKAVL